MASLLGSPFTDQLGAWGSVLAAVGTVAAFVVAFWQIRTERQARLRREDEAATEAHRAQADRIHAWYSGEGGRGTRITLLNGSEEPVYRAAVVLVFISGGAGPRTGKEQVELSKAGGGSPYLWQFLSIIPPGVHETSVGGGWGGMMKRPGVEIAFTDRSGAHWVRSGEGTLTEIPIPARLYYGLDEPLDWEVPVGS
jgi:hypothetical protein